MKKEGDYQSNPIKSSGIRDWLMAARESGAISEQEADVLIRENETSKQRILEYGLPLFAVYGPCGSFEEAEKLVPESKRELSNQHFLVRCAPKDINSKLQIQRNLDIPWGQVADFVKNLPGGSENYTVEVREHWAADYSGTIIGNGTGKVFVEMIKGDLIHLDKKGKNEIITASFDGSQPDIHFNYDAGASDEQKRIAMDALQYVAPDLDRASLEKLKIYVEFSYSPENGFRFRDISDQDFWTNL